MADPAEPAGKRQRQRGRPFEPGQSGNPKGRPAGLKNRATVAAASLFEDEAERISRKCVQMALAGDPLALRLALERCVPAKRERRLAVAVPVLVSAGDAASAMSAVLGLVCRGEINLTEGAGLAALVDSFAKALELGEFERRLVALEEARSCAH